MIATSYRVPLTNVSTLISAHVACPFGWFLDPGGFSCYKVSEVYKAWSDAKQDCDVSGGYLVKIDDEAEQHFIEDYLEVTGFTQLIMVCKTAA